MAQLCELPPELVIGIFKHLDDRRAMQDLMTSAPTDEAFTAILRSSWHARFSLSVVNRRYHKITRRLVYRTISIHKRGFIWRLISLLRFLRANPDVASSVEQLYLDIRPHSGYIVDIKTTDIDTVFQAAKDSAIRGIESFWDRELKVALRLRRDTIPESLKYAYECARFTTTFILLLQSVPNAHDLGISFIPGSFSCLRDRLDEICPDPIDLQDDIGLMMEKHQVPQQLNDFPTFGNVKALALRTPDRIYDTLLGYQAGAILKMTPNATCFHMEGCNFMHHRLIEMGLSNITQLTIHGIKMSDDECSKVIKGCSMLLSFKYVTKAHSRMCCARRYSPSPGKIVATLRQAGHSKSLVSLCLNYRHVGDFWHLGNASLTGFDALESVWLCFDRTLLIDRVWDPIGASSESILMSLPQTLRYLRLWGRGWTPSVLEHLFTMRAKFPNLERVDLDWEDDEVEKFRQRLRDSNIQSLNTADLAK